MSRVRPCERPRSRADLTAGPAVHAENQTDDACGDQERESPRPDGGDRCSHHAIPILVLLHRSHASRGSLRIR